MQRCCSPYPFTRRHLFHPFLILPQKIFASVLHDLDVLPFRRFNLLTFCCFSTYSTFCCFPTYFAFHCFSIYPTSRADSSTYCTA
ncbi:hypothetical protein BDV98DRAFT_570512 [Pterulicium gracile]|uniref:Uncharacterized protein n=1 Tax=Pterulicium gracile TaxID=1884261 RepID=A0A5C3QD18_9AGAR|nr:hypothetical protein BDV98DRAFT_570512 [Pterula gracilis]